VQQCDFANPLACCFFGAGRNGTRRFPFWVLEVHGISGAERPLCWSWGQSRRVTKISSWAWSLTSLGPSIGIKLLPISPSRFALAAQVQRFLPRYYLLPERDIRQAFRKSSRTEISPSRREEENQSEEIEKEMKTMRREIRDAVREKKGEQETEDKQRKQQERKRRR
jgi:hypothetical protein